MKIQLLATTLFTLVLSACGGSSSSPSTQTGVFLDDAVEGLRYETATQNGMTDANGTFKYQSGETIRFYVGDILIGEASASDVMTPVNLVPNAVDETNQTVTNIARFLQTLDDDGDPTNGIKISSSVFAAASGQTLDFSVDDATFTIDAQALINILMPASPPTLVSAIDAQTTLGATLSDILSNGSGGGAGGGAVGSISLSGADAAAIGNPLGVIYTTDTSSGAETVISFVTASGSLSINLTSGILTAINLGAVNGPDTYGYLLICDSNPECTKVNVNEAARTVSFNNVSLPPLAGAATSNISVTANLSW